MENICRENYKLIPRKRELHLLTAESTTIGKLNRQSRRPKQAFRGIKENEVKDKKRAKKVLLHSIETNLINKQQKLIN